MIVEFERVAIRQPRGLGEGDAARPLTTLSISILNRHDLVREVTLIHVKVQAIHGNQLDESDVISLLLLL